MKSTVMIKDLVMDETLDRKAMATVFGGNNPGMASAGPSDMTSPTVNVTGSGLTGPTGNVTSSSGKTRNTTDEIGTFMLEIFIETAVEDALGLH